MKLLRFLTVAALMAALAFVTSCSSQRGLGRHNSGQEQIGQASDRGVSKTSKKEKDSNVGTEQPATQTPIADKTEPLRKVQFLQQVTDNFQHARFITSKVKFSVEAGTRQMTLTGNLKMKRDDVIRLQLMAFGFVEAARLEFTPEYALIIDRINKQYLKVTYKQLDFFRNSGIDFYVLQALFWNELFQPGKKKLTDNALKDYLAEPGVDNDVIISLDDSKLSYRWLADRDAAQVKMANILYNDKYRGNYQLNWDYSDFKRNDRKVFPMTHKVKFDMAEKEIKFEMLFNYMGADQNWETRTELSGKYRQVDLEEILRRFMSL